MVHSAFNEDNLYVVLQGKSFNISREKNSSWNEMIEYGINTAKVEKYILEKFLCMVKIINSKIAVQPIYYYIIIRIQVIFII